MKREFPDTIKLSSAYSTGRCKTSHPEVLSMLSQAKQSEVQRPSLALALNPTAQASFQADSSEDFMFLNHRTAPFSGTMPLATLENNRHRRVRTSAAMVGLALSVGASDVLSLWNMKAAFAAEGTTTNEPMSDWVTSDPQTDSTPAIVSPIPQVEDVSFSNDRSTFDLADYYPHELFSHTVVSGETFSTIARRYGLEPDVLASFNDLSVDAVLGVGEVLQFPRILATQNLSAEVAPIAKTTVASTQLAENLKGRPDSQKYLGANPEESSEPVVNLALQPTPPAESLPIAFLPNEASASEATVNLADLVPYRVKSGDTLDKIASIYQVPRSTLIAVNQIENPNLLRVDQVIGVPRTELSLAPSTVNSETEASLPIVESLGGQGTTQPEAPVSPALASVLDQDASRNPYDASNALSGDLSYQVKPGDTLAKIARSHGISLSELIRANQLSNPNVILVNQTVAIPAPSSIVSFEANTPVQIAANLPPSSVELGQPTAPEAVTATVTIGSAPQLQVNTAVIPTVPSLQSIVQEPIALPNPGSTPVVNVEVPTVAIVPRSVTTPFDPSAGAIVPQPLAPESSKVGGGNPYVSGLLSEVKTLRDRYRSGAALPENTPEVQPTPQNVAIPLAVQPAPTALPVAPPVVSSLSKGERINPEFNPRAYGNPVEERNSAPNLSARPTVLAAAPVGSANYEPLVQSLVGQTVSPALPSLTADPYLPKDGSSVSGFIWPTQGVFTSGYGWRWGRMHKGIDIAAPVGTPIVAAASGVVITAGWNSGGYGNLVEIRHDDGSITLYAHNDRILVREGQYVQQGDQVSEMGSTGYSTGPHLHFEIHPSGDGAVNPMAYLPQ